MQGGTSGYDIVSAVAVKHVPVTVGIIAMFLVMLAPYAYELYKRYYGAPKRNTEPNIEDRPAFARKGWETEEEARIRTADDARLGELEAILASANSNGDVLRIAGEMEAPLAKARAYRLAGERFAAGGERQKAEECFTKSIAHAKSPVADGAESALGLSRLYESEGDGARALQFARQALLLFDQAGLADGAAAVTARIKALKSGK
ncbi:MAG: hypothetical protein HY751_06785 [Nitrospinae bacterium]|nr:hypothetical protein [Nitrospinota bacterium]